MPDKRKGGCNADSGQAKRGSSQDETKNATSLQWRIVSCGIQASARINARWPSPAQKQKDCQARTREYRIESGGGLVSVQDEGVCFLRCRTRSCFSGASPSFSGVYSYVYTLARTVILSLKRTHAHLCTYAHAYIHLHGTHLYPKFEFW